MIRRHISLLVAFVLCAALLLSFASAEGIMPRADSEFDSATPNLLSSKSVKFTADTYDVKNRISVTACWLERSINGTWTRVCSLTPPSYVATNTFFYGTTVSYASQIGTGTYRVWATFNADGHSITRCSNARAF